MTTIDRIDDAPSAQCNDAMLDALERLRGTGPEFGGFLSNHGPMAAEAMVRLGGAEVVGRWVDAYRVQLEPAPTGRPLIDDHNWRSALGDMRHLGDWNHYFERSIRARPWRDILTDWWPRLLPGIAAGGSHGLIRTAHAVRSLATAPADEPLLTEELAHGLAYWSARYQPVPGSPTLGGIQSSRDALHALSRMPATVPSAGPGLLGRLAALATLRRLPDELDAWGPADSVEAALDGLISDAARLLVNRDDSALVFCHAVTAPAAVQMVLPELPHDLHRPTLAATWQLVGGLVAAFADPALPHEFADVVGYEPVTSQALAERAVEHGDDHVVKLTDAAIRQFERTADPVLLVAADKYRRGTAPLEWARTPAARTDSRRNPPGSPSRSATKAAVLVDVDDLDTVLRFYRDVLGLPVRTTWSRPEGSGAIVEVGAGFSIEFAGPPPGAARVDTAPTSRVELMIHVDDAERWRNELAAAGVVIARELIDNPWGDRSFGVDDPAGRRIWIVENDA